MAEAVRPRPSYRFEPASGLAGSVGSENLGWEQQAGGVTVDLGELEEVSEEQSSTNLLSGEQLVEVRASQRTHQPLSPQFKEQISPVTKRQTTEEKVEPLPPFASLEPPTRNSEVSINQPRTESEWTQLPTSQELPPSPDRQQLAATAQAETNFPIFSDATPKSATVRAKQSSRLRAEAIEGGEPPPISVQQPLIPAGEAKTNAPLASSSAIKYEPAVPKPTSIQPTKINGAPPPVATPPSKPIELSLTESAILTASTPMLRSAMATVEEKPQITPLVKSVATASRETNEKPQPSPTIQVTISRIEVRAALSPNSLKQKSSSKSPVMSLDEYLRRRAKGGDS